MRYFLQLSFLGKNYNGWQIQSHDPSVQQTLQQGLSTLLRDTITVVGAGRTDTGVHASHYVAHFDVRESIPDPIGFCYHLNALLPADIAAHSIRPVQPDAHARFGALSRQYKYYISPRKDPFNREITYQLSWPLDVGRMNLAAELLLSTSDFTSFCKLHSDNRTNLCRVTHARWEREGNLLVFTIQADRFLRNMVRAIVGTLLDVGRGRLSAEDFAEVTIGKNRALAGTSAPAQGLFLNNITYPETIYTDNLSTDNDL